MRAKDLKKALSFALKNKYPILIKGAPGIGKSDIVEQACKLVDADLIISHPVVSDPTDYKGLPFPAKDKTKATFLPFGDLLKLIEAKKPTVFFLDDIGQAPASVQAALMQLLLSRRINGHTISDHVTFLAATNRRKDKAGIQGILEPVKSRFSSILELDVNIDDWVSWAITNKMPSILIAFLRYKPEALIDFKPTADITNSPSPRTWAAVGKMLNAELSPKITDYDNHKTESRDGFVFDMIAGAVGKAKAYEFIGFAEIANELNSYEDIVKNPTEVIMPNSPSIHWAECGMLMSKTQLKDFGQIYQYILRLPEEYQVYLIQDLVRTKPEIAKTKEFVTWATAMGNLLLEEQ